MTCRNFRKFVAPFADGELETEASADALEHLNMCPECAKRVDEVHRMKDAIRRNFEAERAPAGLADKVRAALRDEQEAPRPPSRSWIHHLVLPTGVAAAILLAVAVWQWQRPSDSTPQPGSTTSVVKATFASADLRVQHKMCCDHPNHHDDRLGRELSEIAANLTTKLRLVAIAPDLKAAGFSLLGAHICDIKKARGGHVLYQDARGRVVSVFSVAADDCRDMKFHRRQGGSPIAAEEFSGSPTMIAWPNGAGCTAYVLCGQIPAAEMRAIVSDIRGDGPTP